MKQVVLINTAALPCPGTHYLHVTKFLKCFSWFGYQFLEITDPVDFAAIPDDGDSILYISNHGFDRPEHIAELDLLSRFQKNFFIVWFGAVDQISQKLKNWIGTGIYYYRQPESISLPFWEMQQTMLNYVPLIFGANVHPDELKIKSRFDNYIYDCNYIGSKYNEAWSRKINKKLKCFIHYVPPYISEEQRLYSFEHSLCSLGWQAELNKANYIITERIFETMAFGCLLITDSEFIQEEIGGAAVYVTSAVDTIKKIKYFKNHLDEVERKIRLGYDYIKTKGSYYYTCKNFLDKIEQLKSV